jgi:hypothetical protein
MMSRERKKKIGQGRDGDGGERRAGHLAAVAWDGTVRDEVKQ